MKKTVLIFLLFLSYFAASLAQNDDTRKTIVVGDVVFDMLLVEGGEFEMGALAGHRELQSDETITCMVKLADYYAGETEVTQRLWETIMGSNPSFNKDGENLPVEMVTWNECQKFISRLNLQTGLNFRLLTEAEWEYAARGGSHSHNCLYSGSEDIGEVAWHDENSDGHSHPVKGLQPNELGLYDMSGNVWEWVSDRFDAYTESPKENPQGGKSGNLYVDRGGSWCNQPKKVTVLHRGRYSVNFKNKYTGFRLAMTKE